MARKEEAGPVSLDPNDMMQGGLKDDFRGVIIKAVYARWDYDGNIDEPVLAARLTIKPEDEEEPIVQHWSAGSLDSFQPSEDGETPCDEDEVGPYLVRTGKRAQLNNNTNFAHLMASIIDSGEASKKFPRKKLTASLECLEELDCHWNRVPQKKRSGIQDGEGDGKRAKDVLVVTEVYGYGEVAEDKPKGKAAKGKKEETKGKKGEEKTGGDLDDDLQGLVVEAISENDGELKKSKLAKEILERASDDPRKAKMVKRVGELSFIEDDDRPWSFDEDTGILSI